MKYEIRDCRFGKGVFATTTIEVAETISFLTGEIVRTKEMLGKLNQHTVRRDDPLQIDEDLYVILDERSLYFNHSCEPTAVVSGYNTLVAFRAIESGEEITFDYSTVVGYSALTNNWTMECQCGAVQCRHIIRSVISIPSIQLVGYLQGGGVPDFILRQLIRGGTAQYSPKHES